jgi:hypothetical protein
MNYNYAPEVRLSEWTKIKSREDGEIYTVHSSTETNNQFGYGVYRYRVKERLDSGFALHWKWFDVVSTTSEILKENGAYKFMQYENGYFAVDYSDESVGTSIVFSKDKEKVKEKYEELISKS